MVRRIVYGLLVGAVVTGVCFVRGYSEEKKKEDSSQEVKPYVLLDEEKEISSWSGAEASSDNAKKGKYSAKWVGVEKGSTMSIADIPRDWTQYNLISFWAYSEVANNAKIVFNCVSENEETEGGDYFHFQIPIDWKGWKKFEIPFSSFTKARTPIGWNRINKVEFYSKGWGIEPKDNTVLYFDDMKLEKSAAVPEKKEIKKEEKKVDSSKKTDLACYLKFDEGKGEVTKDSSGQGNEGTINGEPEWVKGKFGFAMKFDGEDDHIELPYILPATEQPITIEAWVNPATLDRPEWETVIINKRCTKNSWCLYQTQDGSFGFHVWKGDPGPAYGITSKKISENVWYHVVATYDGANTIKIYVNAGIPAVKNDVEELQDSDDPTTNKVMVGKGSGGNAKRFFSGMMDEVKIYNRVLSDAEIKTSYESMAKTYGSSPSDVKE